MMENIVLTGFMGTGKTTVGRLLAARTGRTFVDSDELIVARTGHTITHIFAERGQAYFRQLEAEVTVDLAGQQNLVIATGGRLMLDPANALDLGQNSFVFCLTAAPEEILTRLNDDIARRPLLDGPNPPARIQQLLEERAEAYGRFPQMNTGGKTPEQVVVEILQAVTGGRRQASESATVSQLRVATNQSRVSSADRDGYDVLVGDDLLPRLAELAGISGTAVIITDSNVGPLHSERCRDLNQIGKPIVMAAGEQHKTLDTVRDIYDQLLAIGLDRQGTIVALGGGVVGDVAGFVAATYLRGVNFVQCPTSLLAMVDASIGGKTGVDLPQGKNLIGAFKQPTAVVADLSTLSTLPAVEFAAGMAEVVKHGLIASPALLKQLETGDHSAQSASAQLHSLILRAIQVKREVVQDDPFESGRRAILNLGHTFGHAIEQVSGYAVRHGEGVAMGLVAAAHLSARLGHASPLLQERIEAILTKLNLPIRIPANLPAAALLQAMGSDKKKAAGQVRFVLLRDVGDLFVTGDVADTAVLASLQACKEFDKASH